MMKEKMIKSFQKAKGGLLEKTTKADVAGGYAEMEKDGYTLMAWADPFMPDKSLPQHIEKAWLEAIKDEMAPHYTAPIGSDLLKEKIAIKLKRQNKLDVIPDRNILITPGSDSGLYYAILPFINEGDEVIIPCPSYPNNFLDVEIMGGKVVPMVLKEEEGFQIDEKTLESLISPKTKMILITHPNNPTTTVFNRSSLEAIRKICLHYDLLLVCDQAFEDYTYENEMITPASLPDMFERTVTVFSFSKGMGLSGLRVGYLVAADEIMDSLYANAVGVIGATSTSAQRAIMAALDDQKFMNEFREAFDYRRHQAYEILSSIPDVKVKLPESGFLIWLDVSKYGTADEVAALLLKKAKVSVNAGDFYGPGGEGHLRIVLGVYKDNQRVIDALNRIKDVLCAYHQELTE